MQIDQERYGRGDLHLTLVGCVRELESVCVCVCAAGTASVIIALTDGELNEWQFGTAQREVRLASSAPAHHAEAGEGSSIMVSRALPFPLSHRRRGPGPWGPSFTVWGSRNSTRPR